IYVNTDKENGGVGNIKELFEGLQGLVYKDGEIVALGKSFDDFENLVPATGIILGFVYDAVGDYIEIDRDEFESTPLSGLAQVLSNCVLDVKTAALLTKLEMDTVVGEAANPIVKSLIMGAETEYATVKYADGRESALKFPVLYDYYMEDSEIGYNLEREVGGQNGYPDNLGRDYDWLELLERNQGGEIEYNRYMLYYVPCRVTANGVEEAEYFVGEHVVTDGTGDGAKTYRFQTLEYGADTDFIAVKRDENGKFVIDYNAVYSTLDSSTDNYSYRFEGYSYYQDYAREYYYTEKNTETERYELKTVSGKNYFRDNSENGGKLIQLDPLTLYDIVNDAFAPLDGVLVSEVVGQDSDVGKVFGNTTMGALMRGEVDFGKLSEDLEVGTVVTNVTPDNKIMAYIVYRITDLQPAGENLYTAVYDKDGENEREVYVEIRNGFIYNVYDDEDNVPGVKVKEIAGLANEMSHKLKIGDVLTITDDSEPFLKAIADTHISELENAVSSITVGEMFSEEQLNASSMLRQLEDTKISELATAIDKLFIQSIYADEVYKVAKDSDPVLASEYHAEYLYYIKDGNSFKLVDTAVPDKEQWLLEHGSIDGYETAYDDALGHLGDISAEDFAAGEYYTYGAAQGMWRIVLYRNGVEKAYTMNNFNNMVSECAANVYKATLGELQDAGLIEDDIKGKTFTYFTQNGEMGSVNLEELTLAGLIEIVLQMSA
ncbi:MAG: hypothetical protein K2K39_01170, partial [Clostridia bacterium]|nr:hypothetical protein [Clostridia bacterium]